MHNIELQPEMVQRVAFAINSCRMRDWEAMARAAIAAMREPTTDQMMAGQATLIGISIDPEFSDARKCWQAMIDTALKP